MHRGRNSVQNAFETGDKGRRRRRRESVGEGTQRERDRCVRYASDNGGSTGKGSD